VVQTTELRQRELDLDTKIIELTRKYVDSKDAYRKSPSPQINNEILALKSQLDLMKDDFRTLENKLALQENRPPRSIQIDFIPPEPPTGLKAVVQ